MATSPIGDLLGVLAFPVAPVLVSFGTAIYAVGVQQQYSPVRFTFFVSLVISTIVTLALALLADMASTYEMSGFVVSLFIAPVANAIISGATAGILAVGLRLFGKDHGSK